MPELPPHGRSERGFTLVELLAVIAIIAVAAALSVPSFSAVRKRLDATKCLSRMRELGSGIRLRALDFSGEFPRSFHSAGAHGEAHWPVSIAPYLGISAETGTAEWESAFDRFFRCPADKNTAPEIFSYAMNVFYELDPDGDDYVGSPQRWRTIASVPRPSRCILLGEPRPIAFGDHFMCHQWSKQTAARNALDPLRHGKSSNYLFVDGHADSLPLEQTFDPNQNINLWNPSIAR